MKLSELKDALGADTLGKNKEIFIARWGYFYSHGLSAEKYAAKVKQILPNAIIVNKGDHWAAFRGGASIRNQSHFWVEFKLNNEMKTENKKPMKRTLQEAVIAEIEAQEEKIFTPLDGLKAIKAYVDDCIEKCDVKPINKNQLAMDFGIWADDLEMLVQEYKDTVEAEDFHQFPGDED